MASKTEKTESIDQFAQGLTVFTSARASLIKGFTAIRDQDKIKYFRMIFFFNFIMKKTGSVSVLT